jgi:hypothetical protein
MLEKDCKDLEFGKRHVHDVEELMVKIKFYGNIGKCGELLRSSDNNCQEGKLMVLFQGDNVSPIEVLQTSQTFKTWRMCRRTIIGQPA